MLFLLTAAAGAVAVRGQQITREQRDSAVSGKVANEATALRAVNPALAAQLGLAAYRLAPTAEARGSLLSTFATPYATRLTDHTLAVYAAQFSPDARILATAGLDHVVHLYDVIDRHPHHATRPAPLSSLRGGQPGPARPASTIVR